MRLVCAWCDRVLVEGDGPVSHGICDACRRSAASVAVREARAAWERFERRVPVQLSLEVRA